MRLSWFWGFAVLVCHEAAAGSSGGESGPTRLNGIWGESVTFSPVVPTGTRVTNIAWNGKTTIAIVVPGKQAPLTVIDQSYTERLRVPDGSHSLEITHLSQEDNGTYTAQITIQGLTKPTLQRFALHVYKRLTESDINIFPVQNSVSTVNGTCNFTLNCSLQGGGQDVTYTWNQTPETTGSILISHRLGSGASSVTCTARNPVSNSSKSILPKEVCEGITERLTVIWKIFTGIGATIFVGLIVICYWKRKKRENHRINSELCDQEADTEKNTVYAQVGNLPLPGTPKGGLKTKDETKTIYATVQNPNQSPLQTDDEKLGKDGLESMKKGEKTIYATVNEPTQTKTTKSTDADDSAATPKPQRTTEYDKII